ncbi:ribonuclease P protein component [Cellulomonas fimi]|uniref:Ribonuclease P protein component n=1 Tax=Cellulomonas fimi (strain ATCC 484 / DSM 20113 / JCM 1341 / CCUG 24087 / LMG 16345 / NBRC 15513 / NCIMB 8980 / NCTC 7547 / NRS-133) TaxID=590998 RepID=F4H663_CELFA|nr:ribonuclease P protein component [Cellulomonas fimi]AEE47913.1 ribonuclease P protein component [Cellulomonas fimi ATCC 484]NNH07583.1 ribonuclease P protein component [Cellulomonas fimi]VEH37130.1 Ribonuclease P protein component [Cellulomonas fimi]
MLPAAHRMRRAADFEQAVRRGARSGRETLVVHLTTKTDPGPDGPVVGLVVSKAVGTAVRRNLVKRRLRELVRARLDVLPAGSRIVVRALPPAAGAPFAQLGADLDSALAGAVRRAARRPAQA